MVRPFFASMQLPCTWRSSSCRAAICLGEIDSRYLGGAGHGARMAANVLPWGAADDHIRERQAHRRRRPRRAHGDQSRTPQPYLFCLHYPALPSQSYPLPSNSSAVSIGHSQTARTLSLPYILLNVAAPLPSYVEPLALACPLPGLFWRIQRGPPDNPRVVECAAFTREFRPGATAKVCHQLLEASSPRLQRGPLTAQHSAHRRGQPDAFKPTRTHP